MEENKEEKSEVKEKKQNIMHKMKIEKVVLSVGGVGDNLEKGVKLLEILTERKISRRASKKRIPTLGVRPGLEVGCMVTMRGEKAIELLKRLLATVDHQIREKQISENTFSFGIKEYIEIPGMQYQRDIGIIGFDVTVTFTRPGKRIARKKVKRGKLPKKHNDSKEEIIDYLEKNFEIEFIGGKRE